MTAGQGIAHSEETPPENGGRLQGVQLWVALPEASRGTAPSFEQHRALPIVELDGGRAVLPLQAGFEHALVPLQGSSRLAGQALAIHTLYYLGCGRRELALVAEREPARLLLLGGAPFGETILMWWNVVARTTEEIVAAREDWHAGRRFGTVAAYAGARIPAPPFVARPVPRP